MTGGREMLQMRLHFGERDRNGGGTLDAAVMDAAARRGVRAAALLRAVEGFGAKHRLRTDRILSLSEDAPLVAVAVGEPEVVEGLADEVREIAGEGLLVVEGVVESRDGAPADTATAGPPTTSPGEATAPAVGAAGDVVRATIWGPRTGPAAPHVEAVEALRRYRAATATVFLGVDGVIGGERRRARFAAGNRDVPAITVAVGERRAIEAALAEVDGATHLVTVEAVEPYSDIDRVSLHGAGPHGEATRVTLVTSETACNGSHPRYVELIHALRREGAAGATALRGVWGFRGDGEPHGDRVLALRRDVPMVVEAVDLAERAERWLELALSMAGDGDVVYSQTVPKACKLG